MKTDIEIRQDIYKVVCNSDIKTTITGEVSYTGRSTDTEDCIISLQDNDNEQIQEAFVYVNVYVKNITSGGVSKEDVKRTKTLAKLCSEVLDHGVGESFKFHLAKQRVIAVNGKDEFCISNKLSYNNFNS